MPKDTQRIIYFLLLQSQRINNKTMFQACSYSLPHTFLDFRHSDKKKWSKRDLETLFNYLFIVTEKARIIPLYLMYIVKSTPPIFVYILFINLFSLH